MTQINMVRSILINPYMETICEVYVEPRWEGIRYALGKTDAMFSGYVECVNLAQNNNRGVDVWCDEEANLTEGRPVWRLKGSEGTDLMLSGSCLIMDNDGEGETVSTRLPLDALSQVVEWTNLETTGDFGPSREYTMDHPVLGKNVPVYEGGKPIYRERV